MTQQTSDTPTTSRSSTDATRCPVCSKTYQPKRVNAADYRVDTHGPNGPGHMCSHCWRTNANEQPTAPAPDLAIFHGPARTSIEASTNRSSRKVYAPTLAEALEQMHPDDRAALVQFAQDVLSAAQDRQVPEDQRDGGARFEATQNAGIDY